jgi:hypothetical protein
LSEVVESACEDNKRKQTISDGTPIVSVQKPYPQKLHQVVSMESAKSVVSALIQLVHPTTKEPSI